MDRIFAGNNDWVALTKAYHAVSYHDHRRALVRFRDPLKLYPASLQDFING